MKAAELRYICAQVTGDCEISWYLSGCRFVQSQRRVLVDQQQHSVYRARRDILHTHTHTHTNTYYPQR